MTTYVELMDLVASSQSVSLDIPEERFAIVSDIHANLEALTAVLAHIQKKGISAIVNLGDIVGYGADPNACVDIVKGFKANLLGNHDGAAIIEDGYPGFNILAEISQGWTKNHLSDDRKSFLKNLPLQLRIRHGGREFQAYHGSPQPGQYFQEYVLENGGFNSGNSALTVPELFEHVDSVCFVGHTHNTLILPSSGKPNQPYGGSRYTFRKKGKVILNPGSVGQPRDGDPNASYLWIDTKGVHYERVRYDISAAAQKIVDRGLPDLLATRLSKGK